MQNSYFMGRDGFNWFVGVVEDRNDPEQVGRVRVRCLGYHTEDVVALPTADLPWSHVMHPVTDPSMQGLGSTPSWLVEGAWVVGFFRDNEFQQPLIIGSLPGTPQEEANPAEGFSDPRSPSSPQTPYKFQPKLGPYPGNIGHSGHDVGESDTSRLARGAASEEHLSLSTRRLSRLRGDPDFAKIVKDKADATGIPTATKPNLASVSDAAEAETRGFWEEPHPKGIVEDANPYISGVYPYNHVFESESGHITEIDDSPGAERLFRQHMSGTFEEIHPNGDMVTKIIGDNYEIVIGSENIVIKGSQNITVEGSVRQLIKGDYILEVEGDFYRKIHGNERIKVGAKSDPNTGEPIGGNREEEIVGNHAYNIKDDVKGRIGGDTIISKEKSSVEVVGGQWKLSVDGKKMDSNESERGVHIKTSKDYLLDVSGNLSQSTISGIVSIKSGSTLNMKSASAMTINPETTLTQTVGTAWTSTTGTTWNHTSTGVGTIDLQGAGSEVTAKNGGSTNISLTTHVHSQGADSDGDSEVNTDAPVA